jgi:magnesium transporter
VEEIITFELSRDYIDRLKEAIAAQDINFIKNSFDGIDPSDIASVLEELDT